MKKVLILFGTRPETIKLAPLVNELIKTPDCECRVCFSGQHRQMAAQVIDLFALKIDWDLDLMTENQSLADLVAKSLVGIDRILTEWIPDWVVVQGDTSSAMAGGLAAFFRKIKVAHVEAGLRTGNMCHPFPEEFNRRAIDLIADIYFAPTEWAAANLRAEGVEDSKVIVCGNTGIDALLQVSEMRYEWTGSEIEFLKDREGIVLITAHRRESFGEPFKELCMAIRQLAVSHPEIPFVYPVHLNPNVRKPVQEMLSGVDNLHLLPPVDYFSLVQLLKKSRLVLTDSGGIQEEAPSFGMPILVLRETTERPEAVDAGFAKVVGTSTDSIIRHAEAALSIPDGKWRLEVQNPYGEGNASKIIAAKLMGSSDE